MTAIERIETTFITQAAHSILGEGLELIHFIAYSSGVGNIIIIYSLPLRHTPRSKSTIRYPFAPNRQDLPAIEAKSGTAEVFSVKHCRT